MGERSNSQKYRERYTGKAHAPGMPRISCLHKLAAVGGIVHRPFSVVRLDAPACVLRRSLMNGKVWMDEERGLSVEYGGAHAAACGMEVNDARTRGL
jgi:hypothetical protein